MARTFLTFTGVEIWNKTMEKVPANIAMGLFKKCVMNMLTDTYKGD